VDGNTIHVHGVTTVAVLNAEENESEKQRSASAEEGI
jgi:hypothetical protein